MANLVDICKSLQDACSSRIRISQASVTLGENGRIPLDNDSLQATIHDVVRKELARLGVLTMPSLPISPDASLRSIIQQEVATAVSSVCQPQISPHAFTSLDIPSTQSNDFAAVVVPVFAALVPARHQQF